jgi:hypothetical protein
VTTGVGQQLRRPWVVARAPADLAVEAPAVPSLRASLPACAAAWLVSRIVTAVAVLASISSFGSDTVLRGRGFVMFDFGWYWRIAIGGYGPDPVSGVQSPWPFFPLFPGVIKVGDALGIQLQWWTVLVNHAVFLVALLGVHRIASATVGERAGRWSVWALACFPGAFVFSMGYPSAIFLAASVWAFALAREHRDLAAGVCAALAAMVRPNGIFVAAALVAGVLLVRGRADRARIERAAWLGGPAVLSVAVWMGFLWHWTGDPLVFVTAKEAWDEITVVEVVQHGVTWSLPHVLLGLAALVAVWLGRRVLPWSWMLFAGLYLLPPLAVGVVGLARYANECFVPFVTAGALLARWPRAVSIGFVVLSTAACATYSVWVVRYLWVP